MLQASLLVCQDTHNRGGWRDGQLRRMCVYCFISTHYGERGCVLGRGGSYVYISLCKAFEQEMRAL